MEGLRGAFAGQSVACSRPAARQAQIRVHTSCVATPVKPPATKLAKRSKVEIVKEQSDYLRHPLMEELVNENSYINEDAVQLMKFHGSYQQDHREKRAFGQGKFYQFMMRTRQPAGLVSNQLYLTMDDLSQQVLPTCASAGCTLHAHRLYILHCTGRSNKTALCKTLHADPGLYFCHKFYVCVIEKSL